VCVRVYRCNLFGTSALIHRTDFALDIVRKNPTRYYLCVLFYNFRLIDLNVR